MDVDEIRREMVIQASIEMVWDALTNADQLAVWFGDSAEIDLRPGGKARFEWSEFGDAVSAVVEVVDPPNRFSFRWQSLRDTPVESASTLVEFVLESTGASTRLILVESGFANLPQEVRGHRFDENSSGWTAELEDLQSYVTGASLGRG